MRIKGHYGEGKGNPLQYSCLEYHMDRGACRAIVHGVTKSWTKQLSIRDTKGTFHAEFQRIARRNKKAFLSDQCKEIEENNGMGKNNDLFKKIRDTKETFHAKMGTIKDRNAMDVTEPEDIKKKWQEYTKELYRKNLSDPDNHDDVITHLESDVLAWSMLSITLLVCEMSAIVW